VSHRPTVNRGIVGTYHHVRRQHLKRYLAEFDFRYNERISLGVNDSGRMAKSIAGLWERVLPVTRSRGRQRRNARRSQGKE
jgi:hypothetical protein